MSLEVAILDQPIQEPVTPIIRPLPALRDHLNLYFIFLTVTVILEKLDRIGWALIGKTPFYILRYLTNKVFVGVTGNIKKSSDKFSIFKKALVIALDGLTFFLFLLNIMLIVICNTSILNPGPRSRPLSVFYNNIQGFINTRDLASESPPLNMTKVHEVHGYIFTNRPDIIILNETWLKKSIMSKNVFPDNYKVFRVDRSLKSHPWDPTRPKKFRKNGGGVLIAHRTDIDISSIKFTKAKAVAELLSIMFKTQSGKKFCISTFYRVGTLGIENFQEFERHFRTLAMDRKLHKHVLIGDFNLSNVSWPDGLTTCDLQSQFLNFLTGDLGHTQMISDPTHKSGNVLDLLFTNIPNLVKNVKILDHNEACLSDHFGIIFDIDIDIRLKKLPKRKMYNYRRANWTGLNGALGGINWNNMIDSQDPHIAWSRFRTVLTSLCDRYIPKRTIKFQFQPPWYDSECDKIRGEKEKWRKRAKASNSESDLDKFRSFRKQFKQKMNEKMRLNVEDDTDPALISKKFWTHVKSKSKSTRIPETVRYGERFRSNPTDQANIFNEYFYDQFSESSDYNIDIDMNRDGRFMDLRFHRHDVYLILKHINPSKAAGPDGIHGNVLKNCAASLALPLSILFNLSFSTGCIPMDWKLASVVPVYKKGDKGSVENYRPISLTSLVMKVFERCIRTELFSACENLLDPRQHGFINGKSCTTQMVPFTDELALALNNKSRMDVIYFDFAKAFDSVSHDLILRKLKYLYNVDGLMLRFIKSYLEGRQQQVVVGGSTSSPLPVQSGVPQGSILGPLLFVLFINDMFSCVTENTSIALYADDTKIWREIRCYNDHLILQNDIDNLFQWSINNKMRFHPAKCKVLSVTLQRNVLDNLPFNVHLYDLNETVIDCVTTQADLGVNINPRMLWGPHCDSLVSTASSRLGLLMRTCHFTTDKRQKRSFYLALVRSIFEHCSVIWSPQASSHIAKFDAIQKRAVKWINGEQFDSYSNELFYEKQKELNILPMKLKFIYSDLMLFYKVVNNLIPIDLPDYITVCEPDQTRYTRRNAPIHDLSDTSTYRCSVTPNSDNFRNSFFYRTMSRWNNLPVDVREAGVVSAFKTSLIKFLWSSDTDWPD